MPSLDHRLRGLDRLPAPDLWPGITRRRPQYITPPPEPGPARRIAIAALALVLAAAGVAVAWWALPRNPGPSQETEREYSVDFPEQPRGVDGRGLAVLDAETNLPDGTIVNLHYFSADSETPARTEVREGRIEIRVANNLCHDTEVGLIGTAVRVIVTVRPEYRDVRSRPSPPPASPALSVLSQPPDVQEVLGSHFERLIGGQVRETDGERYLEASRAYELPAETCTSKLVYTGGGSFRQVPADQEMRVDTGPFPRDPFSWCPDPQNALPVEAGDFSEAGEVARDFDIALQAGDTEALAELADPSVRSFDQGWLPTGSSDPQVTNFIPSGFYIRGVGHGCGSLVALRTWGVGLSAAGQDVATTYLLVLRPEGWRVWGSLPGGR
jgi:hypothetical protein